MQFCMSHRFPYSSFPLPYVKPWQIALRCLASSNTLYITPADVDNNVIDYFKANRDQAAEPDRHGLLPLHRAVDNIDVPFPQDGEQELKVVRFLLQLHPPAVSEAMIDGLLPLHMAAMQFRGPSRLTALNMLLHEYPSAAEKTDKHGYLPLHHACESLGTGTSLDDDVPLDRKQTADMVKALLEAFPDGARAKTTDHWELLPLHIAACGRGACRYGGEGASRCIPRCRQRKGEERGLAARGMRAKM